MRVELELARRRRRIWTRPNGRRIERRAPWSIAMAGWLVAIVGIVVALVLAPGRARWPGRAEHIVRLRHGLRPPEARFMTSRVSTWPGRPVSPRGDARRVRRSRRGRGGRGSGSATSTPAWRGRCPEPTARPSRSGRRTGESLGFFVRNPAPRRHDLESGASYRICRRPRGTRRRVDIRRARSSSRRVSRTDLSGSPAWRRRADACSRRSTKVADTRAIAMAEHALLTA